MIQLGAQMYTVCQYTQKEDDLLRTFEKIRKIGYESVQVSGIGADIPVAAVAEGLKANGLTCAVTHISYDDCLNKLPEVIDKHKAWGCEYVGVGSMPDRYRSAEGLVTFAKEATEVADKLQEAGLKFVYHNHNFEFRKYGDKLGMDILFDNSGKNFQFELDTFWVQKGAGDVRAWIEKVAGRMDVIHFKDMMLSENCDQLMAEIGQGNLNWPGILETCRKTNVRWFMVEQDDCNGRCPFESLKMSYEYLTGLGLK